MWGEDAFLQGEMLSLQGPPRPPVAGDFLSPETLLGRRLPTSEGASPCRVTLHCELRHSLGDRTAKLPVRQLPV